MARRFQATSKTTKNQLMNIMKKLDATSLKIEQDEFTGDVKVIFDRAGKRYTKKCNTWGNSLDNLRAIQLSISYLYRAIEAYGVEHDENEFDKVFNSYFIGFEATPDDSTLVLGYQKEWWEVLGVQRTAQKKDIINAFRALSKIHHPDNGGEKEVFIKLRTAYEEAIKEIN